MSRGRTLLLGHPDGPFNLRFDPRVLWLALWLAGVAGVLAMGALGLGSLHLPVGTVFDALLGKGPALARTVVVQWRLPRVVSALILGAALGMSGTIFQSLVRNPLGSPDIIGFNTGAYTGALVVMVLWHGGYAEVAAGAIAGGLATALLVYLLSWRRGIHGLRLIIVGVAVSAMLGALNIWISLRGSLESVMSAALWAAGSLNGITWAKSLPSLLCCAVGMLAVLTLGRRMQFLEMGDDAAAALGVPAEQTRLWLMALGTALIAAATAATGPVAFIALAAPQIARRLCHQRSTLLGAAGVGAILLLAADLVAQHLFMPRQLPVGVVTVSVGGVYLVWLLIREAKRT
ncbi:iron-enterobactin ABC transporter permease [Chitiniphilus eburneus]|uniref:iron-enterobactin ABC transporter permease n=1 Tax=Chitiniphilus eburneus TaxID=2571148 RepID=UPI0035CF526D